jgi:hypothetical protein
MRQQLVEDTEKRLAQMGQGDEWVQWARERLSSLQGDLLWRARAHLLLALGDVHQLQAELVAAIRAGYVSFSLCLSLSLSLSVVAPLVLC